MKICTDACLFGAVVANQLHQENLLPNNILDIGTGTGLLSLMLAQKTTVAIDAIELDRSAFEQAQQNFERSPWKDRLSVFHANALQFDSAKSYDFIVSNPPFFEGDLISPDPNKTSAKHDSTLMLDQLLLVIRKHLSSRGFFAVLLPYHRTAFFIELAVHAGYGLREQLMVHHTAAHPFFRSILLFGHTETIATKQELAIKTTAGNYTNEFIGLLKDYYLYL